MKTERRWTLTDTARNIWKESIDLNAKQLGIAKWKGAAIRKTVMKGGLCDGVEVIELNNGALSIFVVPTRGMGIWKGEYKGIPLGWRSPVVGPVHPNFIHGYERGGLGWLYGFDECIVRCGLESNGAPGKDVIPNNMGEPTEMNLTLHGRIANIPASVVEVQAVGGKKPMLAVNGTVYEAMLFGPRFRLSTRIVSAPGANWFRIEDEIVNLRGVESEMELLYHCNFGGPFLEKGSCLHVPVAETAPRSAYSKKDVEAWASYESPTAGYIEQCFWHVLRGDRDGRTVALLRNAGGDLGVALRFNVRELPCFTQWKNTAALEDGYVTGLEPGTNYPNIRTFERRQGRVVKLPPSGIYKVSLTVEMLDSAKLIKDTQKEINELQGTSRPTLFLSPQRHYSAI